MNPAIPPKTIEKLKQLGVFELRQKYFNKFGEYPRGFDIIKETPKEYFDYLTKIYNGAPTTKHSE